jgi:uncharacterized SAM-binding protein YcdF (DUF218 family)
MHFDLFTLSRTLAPLVTPSFDVMVWAALAVVFLSLPRLARAGRVLAACVCVAIVVIASPVGDWPLERLENRFPPHGPFPAHVDGIVVLGGALSVAISRERGEPTLKSGGTRMTEAAMLALRYPAARLLFAGGDASPEHDSVPEAVFARLFFTGLGIAPERLLLDAESRNTHENAVFARRLAQPKAGETWLLVTSAVDMPRAIGCFRAVGWMITPWPTGFRVPHEPGFAIPSLAQGFANLDWAAHEWVGLLDYRIRGWTDSFFPAPDPR